MEGSHSTKWNSVNVRYTYDIFLRFSIVFLKSATISYTCNIKKAIPNSLVDGQRQYWAPTWSGSSSTVQKQIYFPHYFLYFLPKIWPVQISYTLFFMVLQWNGHRDPQQHCWLWMHISHYLKTAIIFLICLSAKVRSPARGICRVGVVLHAV